MQLSKERTMKLVPIAASAAAFLSCITFSSLSANAQGLDIEIGRHAFVR
jgi:hypothetical protein